MIDVILSSPAKSKPIKTAIVTIVITIVILGRYKSLNLDITIFAIIEMAIIIVKKYVPCKRPMVKKAKIIIAGTYEPSVFIPTICLVKVVTVITIGNDSNSKIVPNGICKTCEE